MRLGILLGASLYWKRKPDTCEQEVSKVFMQDLLPGRKAFQKRKFDKKSEKTSAARGQASHVFLSKSILIRIECRIQRPTRRTRKRVPQDSRHITLPAALLARPGQSRDS